MTNRSNMIEGPGRWEWAPRLMGDELDRVADMSMTLLRTGSSWVHRRVETITILDERVVRRRLSVDFTLPRGMPPATHRGGEPVYYVPLTLLRRQEGPMHYDVCDETGASLPLVVEAEHSLVTATMLIKLAERRLTRHGLMLDEHIQRALVEIALRPWPQQQWALAALLDDTSSQWASFRGDEQVRRCLASMPSFVRMLAMAAESNVALVPITGEPGRRRIVKLSYDEVPAPFRTWRDFAGWMVSSVPLVGSRWKRRILRSRELERRPGPNIRQFVGLLLLRVPRGGRQPARYLLRVRPGEPEPPVSSGREIVAFVLGRVPLLGATLYRRVLGVVEDEDRARPADFGWGDIARWLGMEREVLRLHMPVIGAAGSQHVQVVTPPNVEFTSGLLAGRPPAEALRRLLGMSSLAGAVPPDDSEATSPYRKEASGHVSRIHLYEPDATSHRMGLVIFGLRPERRGMLTASVIASALVVAVLTAFAIWPGRFVTQGGTAASLLLIGPGLIATFLTRSGEHAMARKLLRPPRLYLALSALIVFAAAVMVLAYTTSAEQSLTMVPKAPTLTFRQDVVDAPVHPDVTALLWVFAVASAVLLIALALTWALPRPRTVKPSRSDGGEAEAG